ncbi:SDR family oxidoreductase [Fodinibius sp. SL11]|uniref:SDR family oxidoreductase n=1 Tax=Fodinibius sp. SL11 TaxID=3425690 RepID=UPI003F880E25
MSFQDKIVWITGASSGIGEALTYELNKQGAKVIISSRRQKALQKVKTSCLQASKVHIIPLDLTKTEELPSKAEEAISHWGAVDYLFNNGGISQRSEAINTQMNVIRQVMEINFFGTVALTKAVLPSMIERKSGHIVVTSSVMGKFGTRLRSSYAASKHALHGYFDSLRQEVYDKNIDVSLVCPGFIKTNVTKNALEGDGSKHNKMGAGQEKGMAADEFAQKLIPKIKQGKEEIYIGGKEIWGVYLKRFFPRLLNKILRNAKVT